MVAATFGRIRSADGSRPSRSDFEDLFWPLLAVELAFAWRESHPVDSRHPELKQIITAPVALFPPAHVIFVVDEDAVAGEASVSAASIQFDWDYRWESDSD